MQQSREKLQKSEHYKRDRKMSLAEQSNQGRKTGESSREDLLQKSYKKIEYEQQITSMDILECMREFMHHSFDQLSSNIKTDSSDILSHLHQLLATCIQYMSTHGNAQQSTKVRQIIQLLIGLLHNGCANVHQLQAQTQSQQSGAQILQHIIDSIQLIIFKLFTGQCQQSYASIILSINVQNSSHLQTVFMNAISKHMLSQYNATLQGREPTSTPTCAQYSITFEEYTQMDNPNDRNVAIKRIEIDSQYPILCLQSQTTQRTRHSEQSHQQHQQRVRNRYSLDKQAQGTTQYIGHYNDLELMIKTMSNLQQRNTTIQTQLQRTQRNNKILQKQLQQSGNQIYALKEENSSLHHHINQLIYKLEASHLHYDDLQADYQKQKISNSKLELVQENHRQEIGQLRAIIQQMSLTFKQKEVQYQHRLQAKREKINKLQLQLQKMQQKNRRVQESNSANARQIEQLNQTLAKYLAQINQLHITKDNLLTDLQLKNNRLQHLNIIINHHLHSHNNVMPIDKQNHHMNNRSANQQSKEQIQQEFQINDFVQCGSIEQIDKQGFGETWKTSSYVSQFQKLHIKQSSDSQMNNTYGSMCLSNIKQNQPDNRRRINKIDAYKQYETHINYLKQEINRLENESKKFRQDSRRAQDLKYENSRLIKLLEQHKYYRGQENQIIVGCVYEMSRQLAKNYRNQVNIQLKNSHSSMFNQVFSCIENNANSVPFHQSNKTGKSNPNISNKSCKSINQLNKMSKQNHEISNNNTQSLQKIVFFR